MPTLCAYRVGKPGAKPCARCLLAQMVYDLGLQGNYRALMNCA